MQKIKCVIFDLGRVIVSLDQMKACRRLSQFCSLPAEGIYQKIFDAKMYYGIEKGSSFEVFYKNAAKEIGANPDLTLELFTELWGDIFTENTGIEEVLKKLQSKTRILLLSNTNAVQWRSCLQLPIVKKFFSDESRVVLSFLVGAMKPEEEIFREALIKAGCKPEEAVFIDDNREFVEAFERLGGHGIVYSCERDNINILKKALSEFGLL